MQQNVDVWIEENLVMMFVTVWTLVLCLRRKPGGSRRIPGADLGDRNIPALKAATVEDRAFDDFFRPTSQVAQDSARLDL